MEISLATALGMLLDGAKITIILSFFSIFLGLLIGLLVAIGETYGGKVIKYISMGYENIIRGIPLLAIYFILFFSIPIMIGIGMSPFLTAVLGLGIRSSAYQSQIFRSGIQAVDEGQIEAAQALGMNKWDIIIHIVLPQALRFSLPAWMNEYTIVLKDTSIALAIGIIELTARANQLVTVTLQPFLYYGLAGLLYLIMVLSVGYLSSYLGKKYQIKGVGGVLRA
ncbi:amine acid ABC transporter, permease protein, 3-TM region, His/Glu/Gln/Arg/opine family [Aciduliprofundum sp. MAR08-339]|uniref:amino acid ABC transporter permease n=1 Tax=Aciduliprofundum sp. (strain MAR08-339) TaxID=673860 RepID=UPI0002A4A500|nr:amine acid ABC transporter, permease protein, 3-TM region, His/Glu/Gln/Arg/opine family [Aciduliprofundum sp. MAR08-339]